MPCIGVGGGKNFKDAPSKPRPPRIFTRANFSNFWKENISLANLNEGQKKSCIFVAPTACHLCKPLTYKNIQPFM